MKLLLLVASLVITTLICAFAGYKIGQQRERRATVGMIEGAFVSDFTALES